MHMMLCLYCSASATSSHFCLCGVSVLTLNVDIFMFLLAFSKLFDFGRVTDFSTAYPVFAGRAPWLTA